jgi:multiple antibiotic resistance protein
LNFTLPAGLDYTFAFQAFVTLFLIVDPIGVIPIFIGLMGRFDERHRAAMVSKACAIACLILLVFTFFGNWIFVLLGISMYSFRVAGGILLLIISVEMLFGSKTRTEVSDDMKAELEEDIAISPMAVPLLTGPGAITTGLMLFNSAPSTADKGLLCLSILVVFVISYVFLRNSSLIYRTLGKMGTKVAVRLMGLMLSAIAVQFIITGLREAFPKFV